MKLSGHQVLRKVLILLASCALGGLLLFALLGWLACTEFGKQAEPYEALSTHARLAGKDATAFPFKDFPAPHATDIIIFDRSLGFVGFETWTSFRFEQAADFNAYLESIQTGPMLRRLDHVLAWEDECALSGLPSTLRRHWDLAGVTTATRVSAQEGFFRQWFFDPARNRVLAVTNDVPALPR